jgi:hypothetical protein
MDIAKRSFIGGQIEGSAPYQQGNLSTVKYRVFTLLGGRRYHNSNARNSRVA